MPELLLLGFPEGLPVVWLPAISIRAAMMPPTARMIATKIFTACPTVSPRTTQELVGATYPVGSHASALGWPLVVAACGSRAWPWAHGSDPEAVSRSVSTSTNHDQTGRLVHAWSTAQRSTGPSEDRGRAPSKLRGSVSPALGRSPATSAYLNRNFVRKTAFRWCLSAARSVMVGSACSDDAAASLKSGRSAVRPRP